MALRLIVSGLLSALFMPLLSAGESITVLQLDSAKDDLFAVTPPSFAAPDRAAYVRCELEVDPSNGQHRCQLNYRSDVFGDDGQPPEYYHSCPLQIGANLWENVERREVLVEPLKPRDRVVVAWLEAGGSLLQLRNVQFPSCQMTEASFPLDKVRDDKFAKIVPLERGGGYNVVFSSKRLCGADKYCKARLDDQGIVVEAPSAWIEVPEQAKKMMVASVGDNEYLVIQLQSNGVAHVQLTRKDGKVKMARHYSDVEDTSKIAYSTGHDSIRVCVDRHSNLECSQFNREGKHKGQQELSLPYHLESKTRSVGRMTMHNLPDNGFLLLSLVCQDRHCLGHKTYHLARVDRQGSVRSQAQRPGCQLIGEQLEDKFYESKNEQGEDEYCLVLRCIETDLRSMQRFTFERSCYSGDDFKLDF
ncbi:uncharacterized protein LOC106649620 [Trichogramma pretiosum]|uniref:uncharacterized protein LOC106649620 n=1 Tax=Trichogramma pretiosum TaxID=7493 RepID=UPI0006C9B767|nr:uncharacterized protein LOC106649620 [Trichogramma pretiosum]